MSASDAESECSDEISLSEFKRSVQQYVDEDDAIKRLKDEIKIRTQRQKLLSEKMMKYMQSINKLRCDLGEAGAIEIKTRKSTSGLTEKTMKSALCEYFNNEDQGLKVAEFLKGKKVTKEVPVLKRII